jgi:hypothetical protein
MSLVQWGVCFPQLSTLWPSFGPLLAPSTPPLFLRKKKVMENIHKLKAETAHARDTRLKLTTELQRLTQRIANAKVNPQHRRNARTISRTICIISVLLYIVVTAIAPKAVAIVTTVTTIITIAASISIIP